jgi:hypothetical protein
MHHRKVVEVTSSGPSTDKVNDAANVTELKTSSFFYSAARTKMDNIPHTRNTWICYDFKASKIVPTHYAIRSVDRETGFPHLKSWIVETSSDGRTWQEVDHKKDNTDLNGSWLTQIFPVTRGGPCQFIRLVNIGRNHYGHDRIWITAWEIFGILLD